MKFDYPKTFMTDKETHESLKELAQATGLTQSLLFRKMVAQTCARFKKEKSAAFLLAND